MDAKKLKKFKEILLQEKENTLKELLHESEIYDSLKEESSGDVADIAFQAYEKNLLIGISQKEKEKLERINAALKRIDDESYGVCLGCGCDIEEKRLVALPWALRCVTCTTQFEEEKRKKMESKKARH